MMEPWITFHLPSAETSRLTDICSKASTLDLRSLLRQIENAAYSVQSEITRRDSGGVSTLPGELGKCYERLHETARELDVCERIGERAANRVNEALKIISSPQRNSQTKPFQEFLRDVLGHCGPTVLFVCAASLGRKTIIDIGKRDRVKLLEYIKYARSSLQTPVLDGLCRQYDIPQDFGLQYERSKDQPRKHEMYKNEHEACNTGPIPSQLQANDEAIDNCISVDLTNAGQLLPRKRTRIEGDADETGDRAENPRRNISDHDISLYPFRVEREMHHMSTNAPASAISSLPQPFRKAVENSRLWKWERSQKDLRTTGCLATLFPKDNKQDVSLTIWCGYNDGYELCDIFGLQHASS